MGTKRAWRHREEEQGRGMSTDRGSIVGEYTMCSQWSPASGLIAAHMHSPIWGDGNTQEYMKAAMEPL
jgi:hypothetical protein